MTLDIAGEVYCKAHDLFNCWFAHEVPAGWDKIEADDPEDLDAPSVTPAELVKAAEALRGESYVQGDNGSHYTIVGIAGPRAVYVRGRFGNLARAEITSRVGNAWMPEQRVRITFGVDHGRADGAVTFDGVHIGGKAWLSALESIGVSVSV
jgi:hypothetical protein